MSYAQRCRSDGIQLQRRRRPVGSLDGAARLATATSLPYPLSSGPTSLLPIITSHISPIRFSLVTFALELYFHHQIINYQLSTINYRSSPSLFRPIPWTFLLVSLSQLRLYFTRPHRLNPPDRLEFHSYRHGWVMVVCFCIVPLVSNPISHSSIIL